PPDRWGPAVKIILALCAALIALALVSTGIGASHLSPSALFSDNKALAELTRQVVVDIRLPRTVLAILTGASLGLAGAVLQGLLRNALADPGIMGISWTAALGSVIASYFAFQRVVAGGIAGSMASVLVLVGLAGRQAGTLTLLL